MYRGRGHSWTFDAFTLPAALDFGMVGIVSVGFKFVSDRSFVQVLAWEDVPISDMESQFCLEETRVAVDTTPVDSVDDGAVGNLGETLVWT
jgi:hypothetical protein